MIKAGLTGGIGSGKTIVCQVFRLLGIPVYHADIEAKNLYNNHTGIREKMIRLLGKDIYEGQQINRQKLSALVFHDKKLLEKVNSIVHPEVASHFISWCENYAGLPYVIQEAAILFESNADRLMDVCIAIKAPVDVRMKRIIKRQGMTREMAIGIMDNQIPDEIKAERSQFVIVNDDRHLVIPQVLEIHRALLNINTGKGN